VFGAESRSRGNHVQNEFEPFPYQVEGANWLAGRKLALLADEMGLGKTAQAIMAADQSGARRILVICPAIGRFNWRREFDKTSKVKRSIHVSTVSNAVWLPGYTVVTSYEGACTVKDAGGDFDLIIVDEGHYLKEPKSARTKKILGKEGLVRKAKRVWILTGTPAPNHYGELWPILYTFGATKLSYDDFIDRYCTVRRTTFGIQITGRKIEMVSELKSIVGKIMLRRLKSQVLKELPPIFYSDYLVEPHIKNTNFHPAILQFLNDASLAERLETEKKLIDSMLKNELSAESIETLQALARSVSTLRRYTGIQKVFETAEIASMELYSNPNIKLVIFAIHREVIEGLAESLKAFNPLLLYGGNSPVTQQLNIDRFQSDPAARVLIANIKSAGTSVTLTAATQIIFAEMDWVPANNAQAVMRCHRIGQTKSVFVRFFSLVNSIDAHINKILLRKTKELAELFPFN
jgi:SWI/SNF-related matrix-associated actin-dependent regulator of chromatin subfamily A-like protein 1